MNGVERSNDGVVLKKCPFCGWEVDVKEQTRFCNDKMYYVECRNNLCATMPSTEFCSSEEEAIKSWNTRTPLERVVERLEKEKSNLTTWAEDEAYKLAINKAIEIIKEEVG